MTARFANPWFLAVARGINAAFFLATAVYAILASSPFAYEQFIQPNVIAWLANFVFLHADYFWLALFVTLLSLAPYLQHARARIAAWSYLAASAILGIVMLFVPLLPAGNRFSQSVAVALASMIAIAWLAIIDFLNAPPRAGRSIEPASRLLATCLLTAVFVWAVYAAAAPFRLREAGGTVAPAALTLGVGASFVALLTIFTVVFLTARLAGRASTVLVAIALAVVVEQVVLVPIAVTGAASWTMAFAMAAAIVAAAAGVSRHLTGDATPRLLPGVTLLALPLTAYAAMSVVTTFDWGFMLQKLSALAVAAAAWTAIRTIVRRATRDPLPASSAAIAPAIVMALTTTAVIAEPRIPQSDFALDAYSAADPAFRLARQFLDTTQAGSTDAEFFAFLRQQTSITAPVSPVSIDFVPRLTRPPSRPPHIFLFLIDSLRRDYVSVYNDAVTFTPRLADLARDSVVFERTFARYGGTGLAVPAIWAGAMLAHKQYVTPFAPMNALGKLVDAGGYRRVVTRDHITEELFGFPDGSTELDRQVPEMLHTFCGTMEELRDDLHAHAGDTRPVFAHTRPLDLHIGNTRFASVPPGESYPGFFAPYAARVRRIDACFGSFVDDVKRLGLYEDSIIVVTSDHGDSLGEGLRWGHGYTVMPEVLRIPLIVHLPAAVRSHFAADAARVSFATDITPTLYALLGYRPERPRAVAGVPLFVPAGEDIPSRRREAYAVASSYGAVYGVVRHNGRRLYIADAIEGRDYMYDLRPTASGSRDTRIGMTDAERQASRALIREQVVDVASWYGLHPQ